MGHPLSIFNAIAIHVFINIEAAPNLWFLRLA